MKFSTYLLIVLLAACSSKKGPLENQTLEGHKELYSEPNAPQAREEKGEKKIVIAATNDVQGNYRARSFTFEDEENDAPQTISIGGMAAAAPYFKILREQYRNVVLVDAGDIFSSLSPVYTRKFYEKLGYDALTVGTGDFNVKLPADVGSSAELFRTFAAKSDVPLILSNLYELKTGRVVEWEGTKPYLIKEVNGTKVGILGIIPNDIVTQTPVNSRVGFYVENMLQSTLRYSRLMRSLGAEVIVVLTHQGLDCTSELAEEAKLPEQKVNFEPRRDGVCNLRNPLGEYLERLPPQLVDVVIGGRNNKKMANFVNGTLVLSSYEEGLGFSYVEFTIDGKSKKINPEKTVVHQPVFFCHEFFKETNDCFFEDRSVDHKDRVRARFLGKDVVIKPELEKKIPELKLGAAALVKDPQEVIRSLVSYDADISYLPRTRGEAQLTVLNVKGSTLARTLEQDYNQSRKTDWYPAPFLQKGERLKLLISGRPLEGEKVYRVLTDLDAVQRNPVLVDVMARMDGRTLAKDSWNSYLLRTDEVHTGTAAPER